MTEHKNAGSPRAGRRPEGAGNLLELEREIQEKNRFLEAIFKRADIGIAVIGLDRRIRDANPFMEQMLGYGPGELAGKTVAEISHPDDEQENMDLYRDMLEGRLDRFQMEKRYFRKDGSVVHSLLHVTHIPGPDGKPLYIVGTVEDITARKRIEKDLERNILMSSAIKEAQDLYIGGDDRRRVFEALLDILVKVTESEYGFLDDVLKDPDGTLYKKNLAMSNIAWDEASRNAYEQLRARSLEFRNLLNLAGAPVTEGRLVVSNHPASDPRSGGLPSGHPPLTSFMGIPLRYGGEFIGVAGVANRPGGYDGSIASFVEPLISTCASLIAAMRSEEAERQLNNRIRISLQEKETLLKEVHHRVKNNLQVVSSLINLQARELEGSPAYEEFAETRDRIKTMAMIHERLYQSGNFAAVDMKQYVHEFADAVFRSQKPAERRIAFRADLEEVALSVDQAVPCALIINELVTNALKHGFTGRDNGEIVVKMRRLPGGAVELQVRDNGLGLPDSFDLQTVRTLGLELVRGLVVQLGGTLEAAGDHGARFVIRFVPEPERAKRD